MELTRNSKCGVGVTTPTANWVWVTQANNAPKTFSRCFRQPLGLAFVVEIVSTATLWNLQQTTYCWGENDQGQLGDDTTTTEIALSRLMTRKVWNFRTWRWGTNIPAVLRLMGQYCWGYNNYKQLGDNSTASSSIPVSVDLPSTLQAVAIVAGYAHTCVLTAMDEVYCWGYNSVGNLGDGTTTNSLTPTLGAITFSKW